jgi:hypothetical protein
MIKRLAFSTLAAAAFALFVTGSASAQGMVPDQRTFFTFSAPVQLPGVTLPAGKYTFRLADSQANRHIVQVFNADGTKIITTLMAIAAQRDTFPDNAEVQFLETPADSPPALDVWWYPGTKTGHEFVYPKDRATRFAKAKSGSEKMVKGEAAPPSMSFAASNATASDATPKVDADRTPPAPVPAPAPAMTPRAESSYSRPVASSVRPDNTMADSSNSARANRNRLPHTASALPMIGLIGALSLFAAAMVTLRRKVI